MIAGHYHAFRGLKNAIKKHGDDFTPDQADNILRGINGPIDELAVGRKYIEEGVEGFSFTKQGIYDMEFENLGKTYQIEVKHSPTLLDDDDFWRKMEEWNKNYDGSAERYVQVGDLQSVKPQYISELDGMGIDVIEIGTFPW